MSWKREVAFTQLECLEFLGIIDSSLRIYEGMSIKKFALAYETIFDTTIASNGLKWLEKIGLRDRRDRHRST